MADDADVIGCRVLPACADGALFTGESEGVGEPELELELEFGFDALLSLLNSGILMKSARGRALGF